MPMSATVSVPAWSGCNSSVSFGAANVTVSVARTAGAASPFPHPSTVAGARSRRPDGTSIDTTGAAAAFTSAATRASSPASGRFNPVPTSASMMSPVSARRRAADVQAALSATSTIGTPACRAPSSISRASPATSETRPTRRAVTSHTPRAWSDRATTQPSPPLLPRPHRTTTEPPPRRPGSHASIAATTSRPACSISAIDGIPRSSIACRSSSRICDAVTTRMTRSYPVVFAG